MNDSVKKPEIDARACAVIMAGGSGTRFWPLSRRDRPKQFLSIVGERSMLQQTWDRCAELVGDPRRVFVVTAASYTALCAEQLPALPAGNLLGEPQARNTAPCIAWATAELLRRDPDSVMMVFPADHVIRDTAGLRVSAAAACAGAAAGKLVTFGVSPRYPETGYGYVEVGGAMQLDTAESGVPVHEVLSFREKPDHETARGYVSAGTFLWNSGMFVWRASTMLQALERHLPEAAAAAVDMVAADSAEARAATYARMPATSIDYGIMERADNVGCVRAQFDWSDVGSWEALQELLDGDDDGNVVRGDVVALDARDNLVHAEGTLVALLGVERVAVVRHGDVLLVGSLQHSQDIKKLRQLLSERGLDRHL